LAAGAQQRFELSHFGFAHSQEPRDAHEHLVLGRMNVAVACDRADLHLQEGDEEQPLPATDAGERAHFCVEVEIRRLAAIERSDGPLALLAGQAQAAEHRFGGFDLIARDAAVGLAQRAHDRESGFEKLLLNRGEPLGERIALQPRKHRADDGADQDSACACRNQAEERKNENQRHLNVSSRENTTR